MRIHIVTCSSPDREQVLAKNIEHMRGLGFEVTLFESPNAHSHVWPFTAGTVKERGLLWQKAYKNCDFLFATRGGYGASDFLPQLKFSNFKKKDHKNLPVVIGFSDISALHSALYAQLKKPGLHANMPGSTLWDFNRLDVKSIFAWMKTPDSLPHIALQSFAAKKGAIKGKLFGGNLATLTNLIGTPYIPKTLRDHILFFEDLGENGGKVMRYLNQWQQSGLLRDVKAIIFGDFKGLERKVEVNDLNFHTEVLNHVGKIRCFTSNAFGHKISNTPLLIGGNYEIKNNSLRFTPQ